MEVICEIEIETKIEDEKKHQFATTWLIHKILLKCLYSISEHRERSILYILSIIIIPTIQPHKNKQQNSKAP